MNKNDRQELSRALSMIVDGAQIIEDLGDSELEKFENLPDGLQQSEMGATLERNSEMLTEASEEITSAIIEVEVET